MRIVGFQMRSVVGNIPENLDKIEVAARDAAAQGGRLLITPELALTGYGADHSFIHLAVPANSHVTDRLDDIARRNNIAIIAGFAQQDGDAIFNSALFTEGRGETRIYRKSHLYGPYEKHWFCADDPSSVLIAVENIKIGMLICYDVEFPENVRRLAKAGADLVVVPTALPSGASGHFIANHMIRVRAFENQVFLAYVNHCGSDEKFSYAGLSQVAAPDGRLLAQASPEEEGLIFAEIDPSAFDKSRSENSYLSDLR